MGDEGEGGGGSGGGAGGGGGYWGDHRGAGGGSAPPGYAHHGYAGGGGARGPPEPYVHARVPSTLHIPIAPVGATAGLGEGSARRLRVWEGRVAGQRPDHGRAGAGSAVAQTMSLTRLPPGGS